MTTPPTPRTASAPFVAATAVLAAASSLTADIVVNNYIDDARFAYIAYDMPDFDQQRLGDLPNDGVCYCGPTASADLLAYVATHGYPDVDPGVPFLFDWESQANYDEATAMIDALGDEMNCSSGAFGSPCGTVGSDRFTSMNARLGDRFNVTYDVRSFAGGTTLRLSDIAARNAASNAIGIVSYGRYNGGFDANGVFKSVNRTGGHVVTVNAALGLGGTAQILGTRDPWANEGTDDVQEDFRTNVWVLTEQDIEWNGGNTLTMDILGEPYNSNTRVRALEGYLSVAPKSGYTWDPYTPATLLTFDLAPIEWNPGWRPPTLDLQAPVQGIIPLPGDAAFIAEIENGLYHYERLTAKLTPIGELPQGPIADVAVDRFGTVHAGVDKQLAMIGADGDTEVIDLPGSVSAISMADPLGREATPNGAPAAHVLLAREGLVATVFQLDGARAVEFSSFPATELEGETRFIVSSDHAMLLNQRQLTFFKRSGGFTPTQLDGTPTYPIIDVSLDGDSLLVVDEKKIAHAYRLGDRLEEDPAHPLDGAATKGRIAMTTSSTSATPWNDPDTFSTEDELKQDAEAADKQADCRCDLDADGKVDGADMGILFGSWGQGRSLADINRDGTVDSSDLGLMLGAFGACP
jgi:hypothetical protein